MTPSHRAALEQVRALAARAPDPRDAIAADPDRAARLVVDAPCLRVDATRQAVDTRALDALLALADEADVAGRRDALLRGDAVNGTEGRAATHAWLRDGTDLVPTGARREIAATRERMRGIAGRVHRGEWKGATGEPITDVLHIGIGGSALGPEMLARALAGHARRGLRLHFVANVDPDAWEDATAGLDARRTLVVVVSKSWTTQETARNAAAARAWLAEGGIDAAGLGAHWLAVTARTDLARADGVPEAQILPFADTVGGRYSLWSAVGLSVMMAIGPENFDALLDGARAMDRHFAQAPAPANAPLLLGLLDAWNGLRGADTLAVVPYAARLARLPAYLQQLVMESDGKGVTRDGEPVTGPVAPVVWGEPGTDAQHSFFQMLHQGAAAHPVELLLVMPSEGAPRDAFERDRLLRAHCLAQSAALLEGRDPETVRAALHAQGLDEAAVARLAPHQVHPGGRPHTLVTLDGLTPASMGALLALWEHRAFVLAAVHDINPFDQFGVELGKKIAQRMDAALRGEPDATVDDPAHRELIARLRARLRARLAG